MLTIGVAVCISRSTELEHHASALRSGGVPVAIVCPARPLSRGVLFDRHGSPGMVQNSTGADNDRTQVTGSPQEFEALNTCQRLDGSVRVVTVSSTESDSTDNTRGSLKANSIEYSVLYPASPQYSTIHPSDRTREGLFPNGGTLKVLSQSYIVSVCEPASSLRM